jgi:hypothetical protein
MTSIHTATATTSAAAPPALLAGGLDWPSSAVNAPRRSATGQPRPEEADPPAPREALVAKVGGAAGRARDCALVRAARD